VALMGRAHRDLGPSGERPYLLPRTARRETDKTSNQPTLGGSLQAPPEHKARPPLRRTTRTLASSPVAGRLPMSVRRPCTKSAADHRGSVSGEGGRTPMVKDDRAS